MIAPDSGSTMWRKKPKSVQPSIWAASRISPLKVCSKNVLVMITFHTDSALGTIIAQNVLTSPRFRTTR